MRIRNKNTGEIREIREILIDGMFKVNSLSEFNEEWEDVLEEPKEYWFIDSCGGINKQEADILGANRREIGNYFKTKEEAEKAVEKLKAWKRLKDKGFKFEGIKEDYTKMVGIPMRNGKRYLQFNKSEDEEWMKENWDDLDLLFGGEE